MSKQQKIWSAVRSVGRFVTEFVAVTSVFMVVGDRVGTVGNIKGSSMSPTLNPPSSIPGGTPTQDLVLINKIGVDLSGVSRGDVVMVRSPIERDRWLVKRVIATPGDIVMPALTPHRRIRIPKGHCWIEGDNVSNSHDSNDYGPVSLSLVHGVVSYIVWPPRRFGPVPQFESPSSSTVVPLVVVDPLPHERQSDTESWS